MGAAREHDRGRKKVEVHGARFEVRKKNEMRRLEAQVENHEVYQKAKKRVEAKIGFYTHLLVYVGVNILLIAINLITSREYFWFKWPLIGWSVGLFFHALAVFAFSEGSAIKERMIQKEMRKRSIQEQ